MQGCTVKLKKGSMLISHSCCPETNPVLKTIEWYLVIKGGQTFFVPVADCELMEITNFSRWEQAFRIFSNIFTGEHPKKATELTQYNHVIYTASLTYAWENVYLYDKESLP